MRFPTLSNEEAYACCQAVVNQAEGWRDALDKLFTCYAYLFAQRPIKKAIGLEYDDPEWQRALSNAGINTAADIMKYYHEWLSKKHWQPLDGYDPHQAPFAFWLRNNIIFSLLNPRKKVKREAERLKSQAAALSADIHRVPDEEPGRFQGIEIWDVVEEVLDERESEIFHGIYYLLLSDQAIAKRLEMGPKYLRDLKRQILIKS